MDVIDENDTYSLIHNVLTQRAEKSNWKMLLSLITTFVKKKTKLSHLLKCMY